MDGPDPIVFLNGQYLPRSQATLSIEDRGTLFGDGVYEVLRYYAGRPFEMDAHMARLRRSLGGMQLAEPALAATLPQISDELVRRNRLPDAKLYWQITRGPAPRDHAFPAEVHPTVLAIAYPARPMSDEVMRWRATLAEDVRWSCCWIKSLMLLPNVMAKSAARAAGCDEAILHREGVVTEGSSSNVFMVRGGEVWTHPADRWILGGVTRQVVIDVARAEGVAVHEACFTTDDLLGADEAFFSGTTTHVAAATHVEGQAIGDGEPGPVTRRLARAFARRVAAACGLG